VGSRSERRARRRKIVAAVLACALVAFVLWVRWSSREEPAGALPAMPLPAEPTPTPTPTLPPGTPAPAAASRGDRPPAGFGQISTGLAGEGRSADIGEHRVVLRAWSRKPMAFTAWFVPTRPGAKRGGTRLPGRSWTMTTTAFGGPDYAQLYLQTDVTGEPVHCSITVDGRLTDRRTTKGPYGTIMCQG
jgi:hypothetical protein